MLYLFYPAGITKLVHKVGEKYKILANILRPELEEDVRAVVKILPIMSARLQMGGQRSELRRQRRARPGGSKYLLELFFQLITFSLVVSWKTVHVLAASKVRASSNSCPCRCMEEVSYSEKE